MAPVIVVSEPPTPQPDPVQQIVTSTITPYKYLRPLAPDSDAQEPGQNESDILLQAIRIVAKREPTFVNECALRDLVRKFAHQYSLDF